ncbi:hypothetical protein [Salinispora pacifica]|nr:hypothetical protein [Salinispora pacifica]
MTEGMTISTVDSAKPQPETIFVDLHGLPYIDQSWGPMYLSPCCYAAATIFTDDGVLYCKKCYEGVDERLAGRPEPHTPALPLPREQLRSPKSPR